MLLHYSEFESNLSVILVRFSFCVLEDEQKELFFSVNLFTELQSCYCVTEVMCTSALRICT